jgi:hypothetical protein
MEGKAPIKFLKMLSTEHQMLIDAGANLEAEDVSRCCMPAWLTC